MLKRIGTLALALMAGAALLPAAAQAQECYRRPVYGYARRPVVVYAAPAYGAPYAQMYVGGDAWRAREWRDHEWRGREQCEHERREWRGGYYR